MIEITEVIRGLSRLNNATWTAVPSTQTVRQVLEQALHAERSGNRPRRAGLLTQAAQIVKETWPETHPQRQQILNLTTPSAQAHSDDETKSGCNQPAA